MAALCRQARQARFASFVPEAAQPCVPSSSAAIRGGLGNGNNSGSGYNAPSRQCILLAIIIAVQLTFSWPAAIPTSTNEVTDVDALPPRRRVSLEDVPDEDDPTSRYGYPYPGEHQAGLAVGNSCTAFDFIRDDQILRGLEIWGPFANDAEWELAKWLVKNVGHNQADEFLKLAMVSYFACSRH